MSAVEIEIEAGQMPKKELTTAEKAKYMEELKSLLGLGGAEYRAMTVEARNAAIDAVMSALKGEPQD